MNRKLTELLKIPESVRIPFFGGKWYQFLNKLDNKSIEKEEVPDNALNTEARDETVTVSLTSFPARIEYVHLAIKSLMLQSYKPDRIVLWLAEEQFPEKVLPAQLLELTKHGLEIHWCDDLYGHKKYFYCINEQKENEVVITFDDDIIYPKECIKRLMKKHKQHPGCLVCERAQALAYNSQGQPDNPGRWSVISNLGYRIPSYSLNPSPGGGCLIPYRAFFKDAYEKKYACDLAYKNDDLWYMFMAAQNCTRTIKTRKYHKTFSLVLGSQVTQMATENVVGNRNVEIMRVLANKYPIAYKRIITNKE